MPGIAANHLGSTQEIRLRRKWLSAVFKYGVGIALLVFVLDRNWEPPEGIPDGGLKNALKIGNRWEYFVPAALFVACSVALTFVRWYVLVRAQGMPFTLRDALRLGLVGYFFNTFLPGSVGGDLLKAAFIAREQQRRTVAVATVLIDRGVGLWGLIALTFLVGGAFWVTGDELIKDQAELKNVVRVAGGIMAASLAFCGFLRVLPERRAQRFTQRLLWLPKVGKVLAEFWRAVWLYRSRGKSIALSFALALVGHTFTVFAFYFAALVFEGDIAKLPGLAQHFVIVPTGMAFQGFFPTPGGVGGGEWMFGLLYERLGALPKNGILGILGWRMCNWALGLGGYVVYLWMKRDLQQAIPGGEPQTSIDSISPDGSSSTTHVR